jgi:hypothetical protein
MQDKGQSRRQWRQRIAFVALVALIAGSAAAVAAANPVAAHGARDRAASSRLIAEDLGHRASIRVSY